MAALAIIGTLIEVTPWDELQHWPDADTIWDFVDDRTPFRFRVAGELLDDGFFFGLYGPVESGPDRYRDLICNIMLRHDNPLRILVAIAILVSVSLPIVAQKPESQSPPGEQSLKDEFRKRSRMIEFLTSLDVEQESDRRIFKTAKTFANHLSALSQLGESEYPKPKRLSGLCGQSELIDVDGQNGNLEILTFSQGMRISPGYNTSLNVLFNSGKYVAALPKTTFTRIWHDVKFDDINDDGTKELIIESYPPSSSANQIRKVTEKLVYNLSERGFELVEKK